MEYELKMREYERVSEREEEWYWVEESWKGWGSLRVEKARVKKVERESEKKVESKKKWRKKMGPNVVEVFFFFFVVF